MTLLAPCFDTEPCVTCNTDLSSYKEDFRLVCFEIVGIRSSIGGYGVGMELAPDALRAGGLLSALKAAEIDVVDGGDIDGLPMRPDPSEPTAQNLSQVVALTGLIRERIDRSLEGGFIPLILGGDCTITLGVLAAFLDHCSTTQLVYFDGDADLSTPQTTRSGILDAMVLSHILGLNGSSDRWAEVGPRHPLLEGHDVLLAGFEESDLDDREANILSINEVNLLPARELRTAPAASALRGLASLGNRGPRLVHFDVDVIDSIDLPLAHYPHFNSGLTLDAAASALEVFCSQPGLGAIVITEVNPSHDPDGTEIPRLVDAVAKALMAYSSRAGAER